MARRVNVASVLFTCEHLRTAGDARQRVLKDLRENLNDLRGRSLDLAVFSEGVESLAQDVDEAERLDQPGPILSAYQDFAADQRCTVAGSVKLTDGRRVFNSIAYVGPTGQVLGTYNKCNLTIGEIERGLSPGDGPRVVDTPAGRLAGAICFDLNFPELCRRYAALRPDIITFPSMYHGGLMQGLWAYTCRAYFVSALPFHGGGVLNVFGEPMALTDCYTRHAIATVNLDRVLVHLDFNRSKFLDIQRRYSGRVLMHIPPNIGSALITSIDDSVTAADVVREFELELLDDYLVRSQSANAAARDRCLPSAHSMNSGEFA